MTQTAEVEENLSVQRIKHLTDDDRQKSFIANDDNIRTILTWQDLTVTVNVNGKERKLVDNVTGCVTTGLWAVMGPSGCGKSTLLNALACRLDQNVTLSGEMRLNGRPYSNTELKKIAGYVMQDDLLNAFLTVRETLHYAAQLRLPRSFTMKEREDRVDEVIREMGLTHCRDVLVGDPSRKGISGGERRRVCIGCELLTRPALLFMDEPTSGLDSVTALALGQLLRRITRTLKCSMIVSIHQPQSRLFSLFDRLILMKSGHILFQGSLPACLTLFEDCGFPVPYYSNPADHILDTITAPIDAAAADPTTEPASPIGHEDEYVDAKRTAIHQRGYGRKGNVPMDIEMAVHDTATEDELTQSGSLRMAMAARNRKIESVVKSQTAAQLVNDEQLDDLPGEQQNVKMLEEKFIQPKVDLNYGSSKPQLDFHVMGPSWLQQFIILLERSAHEQYRKKHKLLVGLCQQIVMAILIGTVFLQIGRGQTSVTRRQPVLQFLCINQGAFGAMSLVNSFPEERSLMLRERASGMYHASAYFLAKTTIDALVAIPNIVVFSVITYYIIGFQDIASKFIIFLLFMILCNFAATSLAFMISAICKTTDFASVVLALTLEICRLFGGFFLAPINLPKYFSWLDALSYIKYSYVGISLNENEGLDLYCNPSDLKNGVCPYPNGWVRVKELGLDYISMNGCAGVLVGYIIFTRVIAYLAIRFIKTN